MNDISSEASLVAVVSLAVTAYADACAAARVWGEESAKNLVDLLGREHGLEIEELRDAAVHQAAVEPWAAATARKLIGHCLEIADRGTRRIERCVPEKDEVRIPHYVAHRHSDGFADEIAQPAIDAAAALRTMAEAIERSLDVDAALARYGIYAR